MWKVSVVMGFAATMSHSFTVLSCDPVMTCGSVPWVRREDTVLSWPVRQCTWAFVRMSHTRQQESRPPVNSRSSTGCMAMQYTPLRWPW